MEEKNFEKLYKKFKEVIEKGDEKKIRNFLISHLEEFPKETQERIIFAFFMEGLEKTIREKKALNDFQAKILEYIKEVKEIRDKVEKELELLETKEQISRLKKN